MMSSCKQAGKKTSEKMMEKTLEDATGGNSSVDIENNKITIEGDSMKAVIETKANTWPVQAPAEVPVFNIGKITHVTSSEYDDVKAWGILFEGVDINSIEKYQTQLKSAGFKTSKFIMGKGVVSRVKKGKFLLQLPLGTNKHTFLFKYSNNYTLSLFKFPRFRQNDGIINIL